MSVIVRPSSDLRVQLGDQITCRDLLVLSYHFSDAFQKGINVLSRWFDEQFSMVFTEMLPKKVETILNVCNESFFRR
jgi:hypothetical protein